MTTTDQTHEKDVVAASGAAQARKPCPICGSDRFVAGPKGRMSPEGLPPRCAACGALERHRNYRALFNALRPLWHGRRALQFSDDPSAPRDAFSSFEVSVYGGDNSLDLADIDRADGAYDVVIANHVLEHVEDDMAALAELDRISADRGTVFLSVPDLLRCKRTVEYGRAREDKHGHYRIYGPDLMERVREAAPLWRAVGVIGRDPVTGAPDIATVFTRDRDFAEAVKHHFGKAGLEPYDPLAQDAVEG